MNADRAEQLVPSDVWPPPPQDRMPAAVPEPPQTRFQMRNVLAALLGLASFVMGFVIGPTTLGFGHVVVLVVCLPVVVFAKSARKRWVAWGALAGALAFWAQWLIRPSLGL